MATETVDLSTVTVNQEAVARWEENRKLTRQYETERMEKEAKESAKRAAEPKLAIRVGTYIAGGSMRSGSVLKSCPACPPMLPPPRC